MKRNQRNGSEGRLPSLAPLANPYVPFQQDDPPKYEAKKGIVRGTLFPGLDLPFMGRVNQAELPASAMSELQALAFAVQELALYLDTHRNDTAALEQYRSYQQMYNKCMQRWNEKHRPLNHRAESICPCYSWLDDSWPWEYCANKEG